MRELTLVMTYPDSDGAQLSAEEVNTALMRAGFNVHTVGMSGTVGVRYTIKIVVTPGDTATFFIDA